MKRLLMIAFHYPPLEGSSGVQRTLAFSRHLPTHGWKPAILTAHPRAYPQVGEQTPVIPADTLIKRAFALDSARHLSVRGRYIKWLALPDRWCSWFLGGVTAGLRMIRRHRPQVLWSTFPIATAQLIGLTLHRLTGLPWVADFRDSMTEDNYPSDPTTRRLWRWIERGTVTRCSRAVFTAPGAIRMYAKRYPEIPEQRWSLIRNGYDEGSFARAEQTSTGETTSGGTAFLVHSGLLYRSERDPRALFGAVEKLRQTGKIGVEDLRIVLRASGDEEYHRDQLRERGIEDIVFLEPRLPYTDALAEMLNADGLLILQASNCNHQIPAKIYEYLRARRPIIALTDPAGDTAGLLREAGTGSIVPLDSEEQVADALLAFIENHRRGGSSVAPDSTVRLHSRKERSKELATLLDSLR